eukprot:1683437-Pleurochrysis_carterae.AAC.1
MEDDGKFEVGERHVKKMAFELRVKSLTSVGRGLGGANKVGRGAGDADDCVSQGVRAWVRGCVHGWVDACVRAWVSAWSGAWRGCVRAHTRSRIRAPRLPPLVEQREGRLVEPAQAVT